MKKIWLFVSIVLIFTACNNQGCKLEEVKTHNVAVPIVESLAKYAKTNGIVKSFKDIKDFPYKLEPCSKKSNILECKVLKDGYFFIHNNKYYSVRLWLYPYKNLPTGFGLNIIHNTTDCLYNIYTNAKIKENYIQPSCSLTCKDGLRQ